MSWTKEPSHTKVIGIIFIVRAVLYLLGGVFIIAFMPMLEIFTEEVIANDPDAKIPLQFFEVIAQFGLGICLVFTSAKSHHRDRYIEGNRVGQDHGDRPFGSCRV